MYNILYLNDYINYYDKKENKLIKILPYSKTLEKGLIIDIKKFTKSFKKMLKDNKIKQGLFNDKLLIITPPNFNNAYKYLYKQIFTNLNYNIVVFKSEISFYDLSKKNINLNISKDYFYITKTILNKTESECYNIKDLELLLKDKTKNYYLYGLYKKEIIDLFEKNKINYYIFEGNENFFIKKQISNLR